MKTSSRCTRILAGSIATLFLAAASLQAETYTSTTGGNFTNSLLWNFGTGPVPTSDAGLTLDFFYHGASPVTASNDLNLTLNALNLHTFGYLGGTLTLSQTLGGNFAFTGAGRVNFFGPTATTISAPITLGSNATSLTFDGRGCGGLIVSGVIASNAASAPLVIATDAPHADTGVVSLTGANTFAGGVTLDSGTLSVGNTRALGDHRIVLTINGGWLRASTTITISNRIELNSTLQLTGDTSFTLAGAINGVSGIDARPAAANRSFDLRGANAYLGATAIGAASLAQGPLDGAGTLRVSGATGSIMSTSSITVRDGGIFELNYTSGHSASNSRVSAATPINVQSGFVQVVGNGGVISQDLGPVAAGGLTTLLANTSASTTGTQVTIANLVRSGGGTVVFQGANLGGTAVTTGMAAGQGNIITTQINGAAPSAALVGSGGAAGTKTISILPWALGDTANSGAKYNVGSGFVTYDTHGVRLLNPATEYNASNDLGTYSATDNVRVTGSSVTSNFAPTTINSLYFASDVGSSEISNGASPLTITSGALASNNGSTTLRLPLLFGPNGTGEAVISVVDEIGGTTKTLTLDRGFTASALTKSGHGDLVIDSVDPTMNGTLTINGGKVVVRRTSLLGNPSSVVINGQSQLLKPAGLRFENDSGTPQSLSAPIVTNSGMASIGVDGSATLNLLSDISGTGGVVYRSGSFAATINVQGTNTYSGGTIIGYGIVQIDSDVRLGSKADPNASFVVLDGAFGGTLRLTGPWTTSRTVQVRTTTVLDTQSFTATFNGPLTGHSLIKRGSGTLALSSVDNSFSGDISVSAGTLTLSGSGHLSSGRVFLGDTTVPTTVAFDLSGATDNDPTDGSTTPWRSLHGLTTSTNFTQPHTVQLGASASMPVDLRLASGTFGGTAGVIAGFGKLVKVGAVTTLTLNGATANTFTGGVEVRGGTLAFSADQQFGHGSNGITIAGGTLAPSTSFSTARAISLGATPQPIIYNTTVQTLANAIAPGAGVTFTLNGEISGDGGFAKTGAGTVVLGAANLFAGDLQMNAGTLAFSASNQLGAATSRVRLNGGTLQYIGTGVATIARNIIGTANSTLDTGSGAGGSLILSGPIITGFAFTKTGANPLTIAGNSPWFFGNLNIGNGTTATGNVTLASSGQMRVATVRLETSSGATFDLSGLTKEIGSLNTAAGTTVALGAGGRLTVGANNTAGSVAGSITGNGTASVTKVGADFLLLTGGGHTFGGGLHILSAGDITSLSHAAALPAQAAFTVGAWGGSNNLGGVFQLDNTGTDFGSRLADTQVIHSNAGTIRMRNIGPVVDSETVGSLRGAGMTTLDIRGGGTLNFADATTGLQRIHGGTFLFFTDNANMGTAPATTAIPNLLFGNLPGTQLIGGGTGAGTTTISILPYAAGATSLSDSGLSFVTYGANGIRTLATASEYNPSLAGASATENARLANTSLTTTTIAAGADKTVNSLVIAGTANTTRIASAASEKLILTSGALLAASDSLWAVNADGTAGTVLGVQAEELQTGNGNTRELVVFATGGSLALGARITTSGGLTKSGRSDLYLSNAANSYSGPTTVNAGNLVIDSLAALGSSSVLQLGGGFLKYRGADTTLTQSVVTAGGEAGNPIGGSAGFHVASGITLTLPSGAVSGFGGILKNGTGVLKLEGANTNTGATIIAGGALAIDSAAALGTNPRIIFSTGLSTSGGQTLRFDAPMTLTHEFITSTDDAGVGLGFDTNGHDVTLSGTILSGGMMRGLYKLGEGNLTLTATGMWTGATQVFAGTLTLAGADGSIVPSVVTSGFIASASAVVLPGATLVLDNTGANNNNRLPDVWDTPFGTGDSASGTLLLANGELKIRGNAGVATSERINRLSLQLGTVTLENNGQNVSLTSGRLFRTLSNTVGLIRGTNLGATPSATSTNWFLTDLGSGGTQLVGAGGTEGTPFVNIIPGIAGDTSATGVGTDLLTYAADTGIRLLEPSEYATTIPTGNFDTNRAPNVQIFGSVSVDTATQISALKLNGGASITGGGALTLTASTVLATGSASINTPVLLAEGNGGYSIITSGPATELTIDSAMNGAGLAKYGDGTLTLTNGYFSASGIVVGQGTLRLAGVSAATSPLGATLAVLKGATVDLGGMDRTIANLSFLNNIGSLQAGGQVQQDGTIALGGSRLTLYDSGSVAAWSGDITGGGGLTKGLFATGAVTLTSPQAYTGSTVIHAGTISLAGRGALASTKIEVRGGALTFNNSDDNAFAGGYVANRVPVNGVIDLAGTLTFIENANTTATHDLGTVNFIGGGRLTITQTSVTAPSTTTIANLTRAAGKGTLMLNATNLGLAQAANGNARIFATQIDGAAPANALLGGGGAPGSTSVSVLPWAWSSAGTGSFVTYGADGFRPLNTTSEYATNLNTATATTNVRLTGSQTLSAAATANSLIVGGNIGGGFDLTLTSGALAYPGTSFIVVGNGLGGILRTGNSDAYELLINTAGNNGVLQMLYALNGSGGLTKFGQGTLAFTSSSPANSFLGGIRIHEGLLTYTSDTQLGAASNPITFGGNTNALTTRGLEYNGTAKVVDLNRDLVLNGLGFLTAPAGSVLRINGTISGAGALGFSHNANLSIFEINGTNTATGDIYLNNGRLSIRSDADLGAGGSLQTSANGSIVLRGDWLTSRIFHLRAASGVNTNGHDAVLHGLVIGSAGFSKTGSGTLTLTAPNPLSAGFALNGGTIVFKDRGAFAGGEPALGSGYALVLDDTGTHFPDRFPDASNLALSGAEFVLKGSGSTTTEEAVANLSLSLARASTVTLIPGSGQAAILRLTGTFNLGAGAGIFRGTNLGVNAPGTANSATILMAESSATQQGGVANMTFLTGGAAAANSPSVSIIKGAFGDTSATGLGTQLVTYDLDKGVRLLDPATEYATVLVSGSVTTDNIRASGAAIGLNAPTTANALWLADGASVTGSGVLTLSSATVLATGAGNSIGATLTSGGGNPLVFGGPGDLTLSTAIPTTTTGGLIKQGAGTLTLGVANSYTGDTVLAGGVVNLGSADAFGSTFVRVQGAELRNTSGGPLVITNAIHLDGAGIAGGAEIKIGGSQDIDFQGAFSLNNTHKVIEATNTGTTTISGVVSSTANVPGIGFTKTGPGTLLLTGTNTYGDATNVGFYESRTILREGVVAVPTIANGGVASPLGASPADADHLVFDGGTLRHIGATANTNRLFTITENGGTLDARGSGSLSLSNTGDIVSSGSGPRTFTLSGSAGNPNNHNLNPRLTDGATSPDKLSLVVNAARWHTTAAHTFTGTTTITGGGTLRLVGNASLANTSAIEIATASFLDVSSVSGGASFDGVRFQLASGQTLRGEGTLFSGLHTLVGSTLDIGAESPTAAEQLTFSTPVTSSYDFDGALTLDLWQNQPGLTASEADRAVFTTGGTSTVALGGIFHLRLGAGSGLNSLAFTEGDEWQLFGWGTLGVSGDFTAYSLPPLAGGYAWDTSQLATSGSIAIVPEPNVTTLTFLAFGALALLRRRR